MLDDRDYMRQPEFREPRWQQRIRTQWSWTVALMVAHLVVFLAEMFIEQFFPGQSFIFDHLSLSVEGLANGYVWQLVTYQFMHAGWMHLLLNCWAIYMFGRELEELLGGKKFLALVFSSGIVGGVFQVLVALAWPQYFSGSVVGASACAFGLVAAFAMIFPNRELTMLIFFIIPIHLRAKTLLIGSAALALAGFAFHEYIMTGVAHAAHLGGMAMGWFFVKKFFKATGRGYRELCVRWKKFCRAVRLWSRRRKNPPLILWRPKWIQSSTRFPRTVSKASRRANAKFLKPPASTSSALE